MATGGLPESIWETYSSFANTNLELISWRQADRHDKPVYIGTDPMKGTYKRDYEGDFLCTEEAVRAMFADQRDISGDVEVLDEFDFSERNDRVTLKLEVGQVVYIPGAADIRSTTDSEPETTVALSKEEKILAYIKQNGSVSTQKVMETCNYKSRTGARKLLEKMMNAGLIEKVGESTNTIYKIMK